jgi:polar amino acid transport system substrate-binding protein
VKRLAVLPLVLALAVAACGDDDDDSDAGAPETAATAAGTDGTDAPATSAGSAPTSAGGGAECAPTSDVWHTPGALTVATGEPAFPPYVIDDDPTSGEGFESAVVYAVAEQLGFTEDDVTWVRTTFDEAIAPGPKDYDFNIQQYGITAERDEIVDFSMPYYVDQKALLVPADSPAAEATTFADIQDLRYGATIGTTDADYIVETIGIAEPDVAIYDDQAATFAALDAGQIDATVIGLPTALYVTSVEMPQITIAGVLPREGEGGDGDMGMLFADGNPARDCVDSALQALTDDGTLAELEQQWMQGSGEIPEITQ